MTNSIANKENNQTNGKGQIFESELLFPDIERTLKDFKSFGHYIFTRLDDIQIKDRIILVDFNSGRQWTGAQLKEKILNVAAALKDIYHFEQGTAVCISYDNSDLSLILAVAIISIGGIVANAYVKDPYAELLYLARKVEPKFLFSRKSNSFWAKKLEEDMKYEVISIIIDERIESNDDKEHFAHLYNYDYRNLSNSETVSQIPTPCVDQTSLKDVAIITMSSGTTGKPKAIPVTHLHSLSDLLSLQSRSGSTARMDAVFGCTASLDYVSGRMVMFGSLGVGYTSIIMEGFEPETYCKAIEKYHINIVYLGGASFYNLITYDRIDEYDLSSLKIIFPMGAKIIYLNELRLFLERHPHIVQVKQGFGASEVSGGAMNSMTPKQYMNNSENCGKLLPGMLAKIVHQDTGELLGKNQIGILHLKGYTIFPGYYDIAKQRECGSPFVNDKTIFDEDGFYITGDLAYFNDNEELYFLGRQKELMSCRGAKKVLPQELEEVISEHPAVFKVCVLGWPNRIELTLDCPRAFVVVKEHLYKTTADEFIRSAKLGDEINGNDNDTGLEFRGYNKLCSLPDPIRRDIMIDLMEFVNERVGWEKQLTGGIVLLDDIPTSRETGKFNKGYLRSLTEEQVEIYGDRSG